MFKNYIKIAWRNLVKNKSYGRLNIFGLTIGLAVVVLITLWVWDELSFNKQYKNYNNIAQVLGQFETEGEVGTGNAMPILSLVQVLHWVRWCSRTLRAQ